MILNVCIAAAWLPGGALMDVTGGLYNLDTENCFIAIVDREGEPFTVSAKDASSGEASNSVGRPVTIDALKVNPQAVVGPALPKSIRLLRPPGTPFVRLENPDMAGLSLNARRFLVIGRVTQPGFAVLKSSGNLERSFRLDAENAFDVTELLSWRANRLYTAQDLAPNLSSPGTDSAASVSILTLLQSWSTAKKSEIPIIRNLLEGSFSIQAKQVGAVDRVSPATAGGMDRPAWYRDVAWPAMNEYLAKSENHLAKFTLLDWLTATTNAPSALRSRFDEALALEKDHPKVIAEAKTIGVPRASVPRFGTDEALDYVDKFKTPHLREWALGAVRAPFKPAKQISRIIQYLGLFESTDRYILNELAFQAKRPDLKVKDQVIDGIARITNRSELLKIWRETPPPIPPQSAHTNAPDLRL